MDPMLIGAVALLALGVVAAMTWLRRPPSRPAAQSSPPPDIQDSLLGKVLGGYRLVEKLGAGSMGAVYRAEPAAGDGPPTAVKIINATLSQNPVVRGRFEREALVGTQLSHPTLVKVHACGQDDDSTFLVMELVDGLPLRKYIRADMAIPEAVDFLRQMIEGIGHAHAAGCLHRDLKPGNMMVTPQRRVRIFDFGLAHHEDFTQLTKTGQFLGTVGYAAPELMEGGRADALSDQYSLGVIAYELLTGRHPFRGKVTRMVAGEDAPALSEARKDVPRALSDIVGRMMARRPQDRYPDLQTVLAALQELDDSEADTSTGESPVVEAFEPETTFDALDPALLHDDDEPLPCLQVLTGTGAGRIFRLQRPELTLGRSQSADIWLDETGVSRQHAVLEHAEAGGWSIRDLSSRNGTWVEEERVTAPRVLQDGDRLRLGASVTLKFVLQDPTAAQLQSHLFEQATRDPLTGAANRNHFVSRYQGALDNATRHGTPLSVMILDIDHFKRINDTYGHLAGDAVLKETVVRLGTEMRREDLLARYGGEEFVVLASKDLEAATSLAERLRVAIERAPFVVTIGDEVKEIRATVSIGVACLGKGTSGEALLKSADDALYRAKNGGRNQVQTA